MKRLARVPDGSIVVAHATLPFAEGYVDAGRWFIEWRGHKTTRRRIGEGQRNLGQTAGQGPADKNQPVVRSVDQRPEAGIEEGGTRIERRKGHERGRDGETIEETLPLETRKIGPAKHGVERLGVAIDAWVLKHAIARPTPPGQVRADLEVVVHAFAQPVFLDEIHSGKRHEVRFETDVEHAAAFRDRDHARRRGEDNEQPRGDPGRPSPG